MVTEHTSVVYYISFLFFLAATETLENSFRWKMHNELQAVWIEFMIFT